MKRQKSIQVDSEMAQMWNFSHREFKIIIHIKESSNKGIYVWTCGGFHQSDQNHKA